MAPPPVFATRRGREDDKDDPGGGVLDPGVGLSADLVMLPVGLAFDARNVLFTETALNVAGFLATEADCP